MRINQSESLDRIDTDYQAQYELYGINQSIKECLTGRRALYNGRLDGNQLPLLLLGVQLEGFLFCQQLAPVARTHPKTSQPLLFYNCATGVRDSTLSQMAKLHRQTGRCNAE
jgi:hypothetical protein